MSGDLDSIDSLDDLARLATRTSNLFVRWSTSPAHDQETGLSFDELTGVELPGLSVNSLAVESWWEDRPFQLWLARRLYDYRHLRGLRDADVRPWVLEGEVVGRGPDNEPLVRCHRAIAWIGSRTIAEATHLIESLSPEWGTLSRAGGTGE